MVEKILLKHYEIVPVSIEKVKVGAGSDTYFVTSKKGKYVLKFPSESEINYPEVETGICDYLLKKGLSVSEFIKSKEGKWIVEEEGKNVIFKSL